MLVLDYVSILAIPNQYSQYQDCIGMKEYKIVIVINLWSITSVLGKKILGK